jgi:methionyl-tRNA formyltransferase
MSEARQPTIEDPLSTVRYAFAGDRDVAVWVLEYLLGTGSRPLALLTPAKDRASHAHSLEYLCRDLKPYQILRGFDFREPRGLRVLKELRPDFIVGVHFPLLVPAEVLAIPRVGFLNLHPALLPHNRGWHTASWSLLEQTPAGATLHFMDVGLDEGDIVHQKALEPSPADTAHTLYEKLKRLEVEVFREAWPSLVSGKYRRTPQNAGAGAAHRRADLSAVQRIDLDREVCAGDLLRRLRALTTNRIDEAAYFEAGGKRYRVQVRIEEEPDEGK